MGCGSSKSTTTVHSKKQLQNGTTEKISKSHPTETTKQNGVAHLTATNNSNSEKIIKPEHHSETIIPINGNKVTKEEINQQNLSNSRTSDPEPTSIRTERRNSHHGVAFEVKLDENSNLRTPRRLPKLQKLEHIPVLTAEMLAQKQALAEENRQKEIQKKLAKTSKRKKQLLEAREFDKIAQAKKLEMEEKMNAQNRKRARAQAEIIEKQKRREMKAKRVRERAQRIKEGGDEADFEVDPDETYNADEENESWDNMETCDNHDANTDSSTSTVRKHRKPTIDSDDEPSQEIKAVHDFFEE